MERSGKGSRCEMSEVKLANHIVERVLDVPTGEIPWGVERIGAPYEWPKARGNGMVVAILDTGCDLDHPDLKGQIIDGRNFTTDYGGDPANYRDNHYHGTHVAGTVAALANGTGVIGVAPAVKLLIGKVLTGQGSGSNAWVTAGIRWATSWRGPNGERARVISMSLGGPVDDPDMHRAIKDAVAAGILVVCAAGNDGPGHVEYPGAYPEVVEVGATDDQDRIANFSNTNPEIDLVAPGVKILSTYPGGKYAILSGTSMATPHTSAAAVLITQEEETAYKRTLTEAEIFALLIKRTKDLGYPKTDQGSGRLHLADPPRQEPQPGPRPRVYSVYIRPETRPNIGNGYAVQLGFYRERDNALRLTQDLKEDLEKAGALVNIIGGGN